MVNNLQYPKDVGFSYAQCDLSKLFSCMFQLFIDNMLSKVQGLLYCASVPNPIVTTFFIVLSDWLQISTYLQGIFTYGFVIWEAHVLSTLLHQCMESKPHGIQGVATPITQLAWVGPSLWQLFLSI
jgi:hypothetical protein